VTLYTRYDEWALGAVTLCVLGATECAVLVAHGRARAKLPTSVARLSTSLRFFALSWAVLLPYYALQAYLRELTSYDSPLQAYLRELTSYGSPLQAYLRELTSYVPLGLILEFLATYTVVPLLLTVEPLLRQARAQGQQIEEQLGWIDHITERAIYSLVLGHAILFIGHNELVMRLLHLLLFGLGLGFLGRVLRIWRHDTLWWGFVFAAAVYFVVQARWTVALFLDPHSVRMNDNFMLSFAVCKIALTATFIPLVMSIEDSKQAASMTAAR
jgi:hypothetical protein